jgi:cysteinyl-tRNA synthetase
MIAESLGQTIDIHCGGIDLTFPHHENECAQSACAHDGAPLANIWMHNGFLNFGGGEKMSKSLGNVLSVGELVEAGWTGDELRLGLLSAQYRQPLTWDQALLTQVRSRLGKWLRKLGDVPKGVRPPPPAAVVEALSEDLNTPAALAAIAGIEQDREALLGALAFLGLPSLGPERSRHASDARNADPDAARIDALVAERVAARKARNWAESDRLRDALVAEGVLLEDRPGGTNWRRT